MRATIRALIAFAALVAVLALPSSAAAQTPQLCGLPLLPPCAEPPPLPPPPPPPVDPRGVDPASPNPLTGLSWYLDSVWSLHARSYRSYVQRGQTREADLMRLIATRPQFRWFGSWTDREPGGTAGAIARYIERVQEEQPGSVPQIATMRHVGERCEPGYQAGGPAEDERTKRWFEDFARGVGNARVVIGFEPDSLGTVHCLAKSRRRARLAVLRHGVDVLSQLPNATVYLEAGASDWQPPWLMARKLRQIGVHKVRGFMVNATHYDWTLNNIRYGRAISRRIGGKHFIINTAMNGRGAIHARRRVGRETKRIFVRCPLKRGLGPAPSTNTADPLVDAYLYIGRPGVSGGYCKGGPQQVGSWFPERAMMFAQFATEWITPPARTRFGLFKKLPVHKLTGAADGFR